MASLKQTKVLRRSSPSLSVRVYFLLTLPLTVSVANAQSHLDMVKQTTCLLEYRTWFFEFRRSEKFIVPPAYTAEQCENAKVVHARIQEEQLKEELSIQALSDERKRKEEDKKRQLATAERAKQEEIERRPGAKIGMTTQQVLTETNWGRPKSVHKTITSSGTREQWVYGNASYLYFDNGRLTAIQN